MHIGAGITAFALEPDVGRNQPQLWARALTEEVAGIEGAASLPALSRQNRLLRLTAADAATADAQFVDAAEVADGFLGVMQVFGSTLQLFLPNLDLAALTLVDGLARPHLVLRRINNGAGWTAHRLAETHRDE
ncbi:hypothetical protein D3C84_999800 [compost metagenome]